MNELLKMITKQTLTTHYNLVLM